MKNPGLRLFFPEIMGIFKTKFRKIKKLPTWIFWLPARWMQASLFLFYRVRIEDPNGWLAGDRQMIGIAWHNRLFFFAPIAPKRHRLRTVAVVSASRDGQYITDLIGYMGIRTVRGSSSRQGMQALRGAIAALENGDHVALTPDGPRGPRYRMKTGPVLLASHCGKPIVPVSVNASSYWSVGSWDGFQIPKPGARLTFVLGDGIDVPPELDADGVEEYRARAEAALMAITKD